MVTVIGKIQSDTESIDELVEDEIYMFGLSFNFASSNWDIVTRHNKASKSLIKFIRKFNSEIEYTIDPILLAENAPEDVLEMIPSLVGNYKVKCIIKDNKLWIVSISAAASHSAAVTSVSGQAYAWVEGAGGLFEARSDGVTRFAEDTAAPDAMILLSRSPYNVAQLAVMIVEVDVSYRSVLGMRRDLLNYFKDQNLLSVVGIQFFPSDDGTCSCYRAVAVVWSRNYGESIEAVAVSAVFDFGVVPLTNKFIRKVGKHFEDALPPVPNEAWANARCEPVPSANGGSIADNIEWMRNCRSHSQLYAEGVKPVITIAGDTISQVIPDYPADLPPLQDFTLNLAAVMLYVARN